MARNTARTGKLKRAKARKDSPASAPDEATVGELLAALDPAEQGASGDASPESAAESQPAVADGPDGAPTPDDAEPLVVVDEDPDDLGLAGYDDGELVAAPPAPEPEAPRPDGVELSDSLPMAPEDDLSRVRGKASPRLVSVVESLLFASEKPLTVRDIRRVLKEPTVRQIQLALRQLSVDTARRGVVLSQVAGGFRLRTNPNNSRWVQRMLAGKPARLSRSQLEALAVIAYRQPITKAEIDNVRGVDCGAVLRVLLERDLARIVGRKEEPGRPHLYGTTVEFLEFFNLRSLRDMPDLHEFRELTEESRATLRDSLGEDADESEAEVLGQEVLPFSGEAANGADPESGEAGDAAVDGEATAPEGSEQAAGDDAEAADGEPGEAHADASAETGETEATQGDTAVQDDASDDDVRGQGDGEESVAASEGDAEESVSASEGDAEEGSVEPGDESADPSDALVTDGEAGERTNTAADVESSTAEAGSADDADATTDEAETSAADEPSAADADATTGDTETSTVESAEDPEATADDTETSTAEADEESTDDAEEPQS